MIQIVTMLNYLYTSFDRILENYDVYKVRDLNVIISRIFNNSVKNL